MSVAKKQTAYRVEACGQLFTVLAWTKGEARGLAKAKLGIPPKGRLPIGAVVEKLKG